MEKKRPVTDIDEALDLISTGLLMLEQSDINKIGGRKAVDIAAKLNAQYLDLDKILRPLKDKLKTLALQSDVDNLRGDDYRAVLRSFQKSYWKFDELKKFLKGKVSHFQETRQENQLTFEINP